MKFYEFQEIPFSISKVLFAYSLHVCLHVVCGCFCTRTEWVVVRPGGLQFFSLSGPSRTLLTPVLGHSQQVHTKLSDSRTHTLTFTIDPPPHAWSKVHIPESSCLEDKKPQGAYCLILHVWILYVWIISTQFYLCIQGDSWTPKAALVWTRGCPTYSWTL